MNHEEKNQKSRNKEIAPGGMLQQVENIFVKLLEGGAGVKVAVRKCKVKYCKKRGFFEAI